jgi:hypothetical protein
LQKLQLQLPTHSGALGTSILTAPQWHEPVTMTASLRRPTLPSLRGAAKPRRGNPDWIASPASSAGSPLAPAHPAPKQLDITSVKAIP